MNWTADQVLALAPDAASAKAGQGLAVSRKWSLLGRNDHALWGECQGSGSKPYQTEIDLSEPAFKCSCPSRKFPCKHALGLFLIAASQSDAISESEPPQWVVEWLQKRDAGKERKEKKVETISDDDPEAAARREKAKARRAAGREQKVAAGLAELGVWLRDLVRTGLTVPQVQSYRYWEGMAARMIDAQAPGIARMVREMAGIPATGEGWSERLLSRLGMLHLLIDAYTRIDTLPPPVQADVRTAIGWTVKEEELASEPGVRDRWLVLGQRFYDEEPMRVRRTWLQGTTTLRPALLLDFSVYNQPFNAGFIPGTVLDAELAYYHGNAPLRAVVRSHTLVEDAPTSRHHLTIDAVLASSANTLARNPWIVTFPAPLAAVVPVLHADQLLLRDTNGSSLPVTPSFNDRWKLLAISGGNPLALFCEWDGRYLLPLCASTEERFYHLAAA